MPLDPKAKEMLEVFDAAGSFEIATVSVAEARANAIGRIDLYRSPLASMHSIEDRTIPGQAGAIPIRIYRPTNEANLPVLLYFHGGGWVICNLDTHDALCRALAKEAQAVVVSVDYRLAPEYRCPAALDDCLTATCWVAEHTAEWGSAPDRLAVAGDSAGGNLAAAVALRIHSEGGPRLKAQLLIYPVTDYYDPGTPSYFQYADGYGLTRADMIWFWDHYVGKDPQPLDSFVAPLRAESLSGLPPAMVILAECDPLYDEGRRYAGRLQEAGVSTEVVSWDGMIHGFFSAVGIYRQTNEAIGTAARWLRAQWNS